MPNTTTTAVATVTKTSSPPQNIIRISFVIVRLLGYFLIGATVFDINSRCEGFSTNSAAHLGDVSSQNIRTTKRCFVSNPKTIATKNNIANTRRRVRQCQWHFSKTKDDDDDDQPRRRRSTWSDQMSSRSQRRLVQDEGINRSLLESLFRGSISSDGSGSSDSSLIELDVLGRGSLPAGNGNNDNGKDSITTASCVFLSPPSQSSNRLPPTNPKTVVSLPIPLPPTSSKATIKLLSFAYRNTPISKSLCLTLNPLLIDRDGGLYDNVPWDTWTIDPDLRNRDASGNPVAGRYNTAKRDVYNRFKGKDWVGRGLTVENIAARVGFVLDEEMETEQSTSKNRGDEDVSKEEEEDGGNPQQPTIDKAALTILARRILELEAKEARMAVAEAQERLAILRSSSDMMEDIVETNDETGLDREQRRKNDLDDAVQNVVDAEKFLLRVLKALTEEDGVDNRNGKRKGEGANRTEKGNLPQDRNSSQQGFLNNVVSTVIQNRNQEGDETPPPYRGATGYKPAFDTPEELRSKNLLPYSSPYELMKEVINDQLAADVIGCVIENTSLFPGSVVLGGAVVLKRRGTIKTVRIDGEEVDTIDEDDDYGNVGIKPGKVVVVECDCDESIGMALACGLRVGVEADVWERAQTTVRMKKEDAEGEKSKHIMDILPLVEGTDESIVFETQGDGVASSSTPIQIPRTTSSFGLGFLGNPSTNKNADADTSLFDTNNPIQSLSAYDELSTTDKAQILLSLQSFQDKLPRPRSLRLDAERRNKRNLNKASNNNRKTPSGTGLDPLDRLLIPLVDESVRRRLLIREAERQGETDLASSLKEGRSRRQWAKENAEAAARDGNEEEMEIWEKEADFYGTLRADVTQDEGAYSSFLDKDEWYERTRENLAKKLSKKNFGTLLDDIE